ncbi:proteinase B [Entomophthora muscae]|uniref:Proteinase B n=1 Tax=Entomophthora muscae TaxID=34485 RepID=A0ACC2SVY9_9FUNG|nr:proteinase B [Entomophthora muscae]
MSCKLFFGGVLLGLVFGESYLVKLRGQTRMEMHVHLASVARLFEKRSSESAIKAVFEMGNMYHVHMAAGIVQVIQAMSEVEYIEQDSIIQADSFQKNVTWGLERISKRGKVLGMSHGYTYYGDGEGVDVYVVDTGIMVDHPEFEGRARFGARFAGENDFDESGHGTHCAGTVASKSYGVAKKASLVAVRVLDENGSGTTSGVIAGLHWAMLDRQGTRGNVISMSLGGQVSLALNDMVDAAVQEGIVVVAAGGNNNDDACLRSPASALGAITVGATDINDARAFFSNYGSCIDIFAPGTAIMSTWNNGLTNSISGTSMAAPHVAGLAAILLSTGTPRHQISEAIKQLAVKNAIYDAGSESPNLLANNGAQPRSKCRRVKTK